MHATDNSAANPLLGRHDPKRALHYNGSCQAGGFKAISTETKKLFRELREEECTGHSSQHWHHQSHAQALWVPTLPHTPRPTPAKRRSQSHRIATGWGGGRDNRRGSQRRHPPFPSRVMGTGQGRQQGPRAPRDTAQRPPLRSGTRRSAPRGRGRGRWGGRVGRRASPLTRGQASARSGPWREEWIEGTTQHRSSRHPHRPLPEERRARLPPPRRCHPGARPSPPPPGARAHSPR